MGDSGVGLKGKGWAQTLEIGGTYTLGGLHHVYLDSLHVMRTKFGCIGIGEAWPGIKVASFDVLEPCRFDGESRGSMKVPDEGLCVGQIADTKGAEGGLLGGWLGDG